VRFILFVAIGIAVVWGATIYFASGFDPVKQGEAARQTVKVGMTHDEVEAEIGPPRKFHKIIERTDEDGGTFLAPSSVDVEWASFDSMLDAGKLEHGFVWPYRHSEKTAFNVYFDGQGKVETIEDAASFDDLLQQ